MDPVNLMAELWFDSEPELDQEALAAAVAGADLAGEEGPIVHPRFIHQYADGERAAITTLVAVPEGRETPGTAQTWDWDEADAVLARCSYPVLVGEMLGRLHPYRDRLEAFLATLRAAVRLLSPAAVWCPNSTRIVRPRQVLEDDVAALVNVRMYQVEEGGLLMDTLGLHALGLRDAQYRFHAEEPNAIATILYDLAAYLLDRGDVVHEGDTVGDLPWRCREAEAMVAPARPVLNLTRD